MIRVYLVALTLVTVLIGVNSAAAQQDMNGNGLYEVCVLSTGEHEGQVHFEFAELSAEEMATSNLSHVSYYHPNSDGTCPETPDEANYIPRDSLPPTTTPPPTEAAGAAEPTADAAVPVEVVEVESTAVPSTEPVADSGTNEEDPVERIPVCITGFEMALHIEYVTAKELAEIQSGALQDDPLVNVGFSGYPDTNGSCVTENGVLKPEYVGTFMTCVPNSEGILIPHAAISHYILDPSTVIVADPMTGACPSGDGSETPVPIAWICGLTNSPTEDGIRWYFRKSYAVEVSVEEHMSRFPFAYRIGEGEGCVAGEFESEAAAVGAAEERESPQAEDIGTPSPGSNAANQASGPSAPTISGGINGDTVGTTTPTVVAIAPAEADSTTPPEIDQFGERRTIRFLTDEWTVEVQTVEVRDSIEAENGQVLEPQNGKFLVVWFDQASPARLPLPLGNFSLEVGTTATANPGEARQYELAEPATVALIDNEYNWNPRQMDANSVYRTGVVFDVSPDDAPTRIIFEMGGQEFVNIEID